jgi:hypothetical protein
MYLQKSLAVAAAAFLALASAQVDAVAHGFGGSHGGWRPGFNRGSYRGHGFDHLGHHDSRGHHWARHDLGRWNGSRLGGHFGHWEPGHWRAASGFGDHGHRSPHPEGVWGL